MNNYMCRFLVILVISVLVLGIPFASLAQDISHSSRRARMSVSPGSERTPETIAKELEMLDLDLKILDQNRQRSALNNKQMEQQEAQREALADLDRQIAELRDKREGLQHEQSVQQLKNQMQMLELDHQIREYNQKRQALQKEHQQEQAKTRALMRELDEKIRVQSYERQAIQLQQRREQLMKELEELKKGQQKPKESK